MRIWEGCKHCIEIGRTFVRQDQPFHYCLSNLKMLYNLSYYQNRGKIICCLLLFINYRVIGTALINETMWTHFATQQNCWDDDNGKSLFMFQMICLGIILSITRKSLWGSARSSQNHFSALQENLLKRFLNMHPVAQLSISATQEMWQRWLAYIPASPTYQLHQPVFPREEGAEGDAVILLSCFAVWGIELKFLNLMWKRGVILCPTVHCHHLLLLAQLFHSRHSDCWR